MSISNNKPCPVCGRYLNRAMSVDALVVKDGKVLLILRGEDPYKGYWAIPGGHLDFDETLEDAALRELKEETNLKGSQTQLLGTYSNPKRHPKQTAAATFIILDPQGEEKPGDDAKECKYFPLDKLPENLAFDHREIIDDYKHSTFNK
ncbi:hypothetical protein A3D77_01960 [Candidatus Gottesmanbacteria bacterium RIFCSPHIGHO2_02_FULL_39_11]|uniref:Nudix hydrolase domain-containing protein n=1 Tax=Candidatus Gottesmanbacteria bacterium RIFCSPHIGHO2_02_FULL_39_11 TaxID=1798382 RepID=A0A1F5ZUA8_9BACT|nr:MAG: hypothetical protein A3D77_01960 [Candidatus Gottesmanbacteria bacterium RIFCSPHIGHO2_02_FULL_39_11]